MPHYKSAALAALALTACPSGNVDAFGIVGQSSNSRRTTTLPIRSTTTTFVAQTSSRRHTPSSFPLTPKPLLSTSLPNKQTPRTILNLAEPGGMDELQELIEHEKPTTKTVRKMPTLWKLAGYASVPVSAALGFVMTPSRRLAAHTVGSVFTGALGAVGKSRLDAASEAAAVPALAQEIVDLGLDSNVLPERIMGVQEVYGILDEDFSAMKTDIYKRYLLGMVKSPFAKTTELNELDKLKNVLGLSNLDVGEAHANAAKEWYRQTCLFTPVEDLDDVDHPDRMALDKFLFLSERAFRQNGETDEAFKYEMSRIAKAFELDSMSVALERVMDVAEPFYRRALASTRAKVGTGEIKSDMLKRARNTVGIPEELAREMHITAYNEEVRTMLGKPAVNDDDDDDDEEGEGGSAEEAEVDMALLKFPEGAQERLDKLRDILELTQQDADYELAVEATPPFQAVALRSMNDAIANIKTPDEAWTDMVQRRQELLFKEDAMRDLLTSIVSQALGNKLLETNVFAKVNNEAATYENLLGVLDATAVCTEVLKRSGWDDMVGENFDKKFFNPQDSNSAAGLLDYGERRKMYKIFVTRAIRASDESGKTGLTEEQYDKVDRVKNVLGISDRDAQSVARTLFGPELNSVLSLAAEEIMGDDYTEELVANLKKMIDDVIANYKLQDSLVKDYGMALYADVVEKLGEESPSGIPTEEQGEALASLRDLYKIEEAETYPIHQHTFGSEYKKAVLEAMGATGVIDAEYRAPLINLRGRLCMSESECKKLFLEAVKEKMIPMVEYIANDMERAVLTKEQISRKKGIDLGQDVFKSGRASQGVLGLGAEGNVMSDIMNLVDFYTENDITEKKEVGTKTVEKTIKDDDGNDQTITEEVPVYETTYPVTALGERAIDPQMAELLYRQFVVGGFTSQGPNAARYEGAKATFGGILGLSSSKMEEIGGNIGSMVYDNYITQSMTTKGALDQQDMMFLANIQGKLGLTSEQSEEMLLSSQKKILSEEVSGLNRDPVKIKAFREKCNSMGIDLQKDVGMVKSSIVQMFEDEIDPGLALGEITPESSDILTEIQESLGLEPEEAEKIFENLLLKRGKYTYDMIQRELLRGRVEKTVDNVLDLVRYAKFVDGDLGLEVPEATANQIYNIYDSMDFSEEDPKVVENNVELLRTAVGLS